MVKKQKDVNLVHIGKRLAKLSRAGGEQLIDNADGLEAALRETRGNPSAILGALQAVEVTYEGLQERLADLIPKHSSTETRVCCERPRIPIPHGISHSNGGYSSGLYKQKPKMQIDEQRDIVKTYIDQTRKWGSGQDVEIEFTYMLEEINEAMEHAGLDDLSTSSLARYLGHHERLGDWNISREFIGYWRIHA